MLKVKTCLRPSAIEGIGLFADQFIPRGQLVWRFTPGLDIHIEKETLTGLGTIEQEQLLRYAYVHERLGTYVLCADNARFLNHSDTPNIVDFDFDTDDAAYSIAAQDIAAGQELTVDYRKFDAEYRKKGIVAGDPGGPPPASK